MAVSDNRCSGWLELGASIGPVSFSCCQSSPFRPRGRKGRQEESKQVMSGESKTVLFWNCLLGQEHIFCNYTSRNGACLQFSASWLHCEFRIKVITCERKVKSPGPHLIQGLRPGPRSPGSLLGTQNLPVPFRHHQKSQCLSLN